MTDDPVVICHKSTDTVMHFIINNFSRTPLFQFYNDDIVMVVIVGTKYDEINALGSLRNIVFNCYLDIVFYLTIINDIPHKLHGILPGFEFSLMPGI